MKSKSVKFLENECWYGGSVTDAFATPIKNTDFIHFDLTFNDTYNQINPIFISNYGRYIWLEKSGDITFNHGIIEIKAKSIYLGSGKNKTLKDGYVEACHKFFPVEKEKPDDSLFRNPQVCTWVYLKTNQNEEDILEYAQKYVDACHKPGLFIIDDGWQINNGDWDFNTKKFPHAKETIKKLHDLGFKVSLWMVPYITIGTETCKELEKNDCLVKDSSGNLLKAVWFDGTSYILDFSKKQTKILFDNIIKYLKENYGIDGFKLDCGDALYLPRDTKNTNGLLEKWVNSIDRNTNILEFRCCYKFAGKNCVQRLADKAHSWSIEYVNLQNNIDKVFIKYGLNSVIPGILTQGLLGYHYSCPDMVGGGLAYDFNEENLDKELLIRWCQAVISMPMIQFSFSYWQSKDNDLKNCFTTCLGIRDKLMPYILELANKVSETSLPILRMMEFEFPHMGFENNLFQFMLGDKYLIAPITNKGEKSKTVYFPKGTSWKNIITNDLINEESKMFNVDLKTILIFERIK